MERWYVVYTQPRAEEQAFWHLQNQGYRSFLPKLEGLRKHARRKVVGLEPLFPRYLFTRFDGAMTRWRSINGSRGVVSLLTQSGTPLPVAGGVVESLIAEADANAVVPAATLRLLSRGSRVRILSGPLEGQFAEVEELKQNGMARVRLLMALLGKVATLQLPGYAVEPA